MNTKCIIKILAIFYTLLIAVSCSTFEKKAFGPQKKYGLVTVKTGETTIENGTYSMVGAVTSLASNKSTRIDLTAELDQFAKIFDSKFASSGDLKLVATEAIINDPSYRKANDTSPSILGMKMRLARGFKNFEKNNQEFRAELIKKHKLEGTVTITITFGISERSFGVGPLSVGKAKATVGLTILVTDPNDKDLWMQIVSEDSDESIALVNGVVNVGDFKPLVAQAMKNAVNTLSEDLHKRMVN